MEFRVLGSLEALDGDRRLDLGTPRQRALLAFLLLHANEVVSTDRIVDELWPEGAPASAPKIVQVYVSHLRKALGVAREVLVRRGPGYVLRVETGELDLSRFEELVERAAREEPPAKAETLREALALWRGETLEEFAYESFVQTEAARLEELRLLALEERIEADLALGRGPELVPELEALVAEHPLRERPRGQLMLALYRCGRQAEALEAYQQARQALVDGLGIEPGRSLRELHKQILRQDEHLDSAQHLRESAPRLPPGLSEPPFAVNRLVGRARELAEVGELLRGDVRLLTLTGPGGTGKTRLAVEVARRLAPAFDERARFVSLAPLADPNLVLPTITRALGIRPRDGESEPEALRRVLEDASLLLILDNYEHLLEAAPVASQLAAAIPHLTILVTSRAPLHVTGEHLWPVSPLELPETDSSRDPGELGKVAAVALFVERARAVQRTFELGEDKAAAVAEVCVRLDGLPLAIELAAARVAVVPPEAMLSRLDRALPLLASGPRDAPERQRTLESTIGWSYDLLTDQHRMLVRRFSVFSGGWTVEAAIAVCDAPLDDIEGLVEANLVRQAGVDGERRFTMLRTIREFARDRLIKEGEQVEAERRHADYFLGLAQGAEGELLGPNRADWLARLELEHDNLRAALVFGLHSGPSELALTLACSLFRFWHTHGHFVEGARWLTLSLEAVVSPPPALAGKALRRAARLHVNLGNLVEARALAEQSVELTREHGDLAEIRDALDTLALVLWFEEDVGAAGSLWQEVSELARQTGDSHREANSTVNLGYIALMRHDFERAETLFRRSRELYSEVGERAAEGFALVNLALVNLQDDHRYVEAVDLLKDGLAACMEVGSKQGVSYCFEVLAAMAAERSRPVDAARLLACAEQLRDEIGIHLEPYEQVLHDSTAAYATDALGSEHLARERECGLDMTLDEACAYARGLCAVLVLMTGKAEERS
jgi:predicted ATPase/DNA-binding SARP family transcriptional activator